MKKFLSILLSFVMLLSITAGIDLYALAAISKDGNWSYQYYSDGTADIERYYGTETNVVIPSKVDGYTVTNLVGQVFHDRPRMVTVDSEAYYRYYVQDHIESVTIPNTVKKIEDGSLYGAFESCYNLKEVVFGSGLEYIGIKSFQNCDKLEKINIPAVTTIEESAFCNCDNLKSVVLPSTLTKIGKNAFYNCFNLNDVTIYSKKIIIDAGAFSKVPNMTLITYTDTTIYDVAKGYYMSAEEWAQNNRIAFKSLPVSTKTLKVSLSKTSYVYDGKVKKPTVTVKDSNGNKIS